MNKDIDVITAVVIDETSPLTLQELCQALTAEQDFVVLLIEHEIVTPLGKQHDDWRFDSEALRRARLARDFYYDLEVNLNGIALALELLERIK